MLDEETGEPTPGRYVVCQLVMHEDPETALVLARENGLQVNDEEEMLFLNEMRYLRMRNWLLDCFYPPKASPKQQRKDMVIEGRLVQYWEANTEDGGKERIDFSKLPKVKF
jgi:hypothetical protein